MNFNGSKKVLLAGAKGPLRSESSEQTILVARLRQFHKDLLVMSIPNGGKRDPRAAAQMKREGLLAGAPDLLIAEPRAGWHGLFVEMKRADGQTSAVQKEVIEQLRKRGYNVIVCKGADEAYKAILSYCYGDDWPERFAWTKRLLALTGSIPC